MPAWRLGRTKAGSHIGVPPKTSSLKKLVATRTGTSSAVSSFLRARTSAPGSTRRAAATCSLAGSEPT